MSFAILAVIAAVALLGPILAWPARWHVPVVLGELLAGIALGKTGIGYMHADNQTFALLADIGFALVMFVAGTHVPVRDPQLRPALRVGIARAVLVGAVATAVGAGTSAAFGTGHPALYAVLMASSSAALVLPIVDSLKLGGDPVLQLLPQIAIADAVCIVALPLAIDPAHAVRAAVGAALVLLAGVGLFFLLDTAERSGLRRRLHEVSEKRKFAFELRTQLAILFALAALAVRGHVSIMLAGFTFGVAVSAVGQPRRVARQLFALTEGFLGPLFFVWLGASLNLRELGSHPKFIALGVCLGIGATVSHLVGRLAGQPVSLGLLAAAQLGVPVAAATVGGKLGVLRPGESSALILGALVTISLAVLGAGRAVRSGLTADKAKSGNG
jgi:Kef-type K+ transport system membrane component KefB